MSILQLIFFVVFHRYTVQVTVIYRYSHIFYKSYRTSVSLQLCVRDGSRGLVWGEGEAKFAKVTTHR